jgi:hypothetical protein
LEAILQADTNDNDTEREQLSKGELAELDMPELRAKYGPFVDLDIHEV